MNTIYFIHAIYVIYLIFFAVFFLAIGSFLNTVISRLPTKYNDKYNNITEPQSWLGLIKNFSFPRSHCICCKHPLSIPDLIPLISYYRLRARCRYCQVAISFRYPLVEMLTLILSLLVLFFFCLDLSLGLFGSSGVNTTLNSGMTASVTSGVIAGLISSFHWQTIPILLFTWSLITIAFIDIEHFIIPNFITIPFILLGLGFNYFGLFQSFENALLGAIAGFASLWAILYLYKFLTKKAGMGFGDLKMLAMLGAWLGWQVIPFIILFSSLLGATFGIILIILGRANRDSPLPFGAFLALGGYGALFIMPGFFHT